MWRFAVRRPPRERPLPPLPRCEPPGAPRARLPPLLMAVGGATAELRRRVCQRCGAAPLGLCEGVHGLEAPTEPLHEVVCQLCGGMRVFAGETRAERRVCGLRGWSDCVSESRQCARSNSYGKFRAVVDDTMSRSRGGPQNSFPVT